MTDILSIGRIPRHGGSGVYVVGGTSSVRGTCTWPGTFDDGIGSFQTGLSNVAGVFAGLSSVNGTNHHILAWGTRDGYGAIYREFVGTGCVVVGTKRALPFSWLAFGK